MIDLGNNDDPVAVTQMLKFFYDGTYHLTEPLNDLCLKHLKDSCLKYLAMYRLADFYDAPALREDASSRLILCLNHMPCGVKGDDHVRIIQKILGPDTEPFADNDIKRIVWNHILTTRASCTITNCSRFSWQMESCSRKESPTCLCMRLVRS